MKTWSADIHEIRRLVIHQRITSDLLQDFRTPAARYFLEAFFFVDRPDVTERLNRLAGTYMGGSEPEHVLQASFLDGPNTPLSRELFVSCAPSFSLPGTGAKGGGKAADMVADLGDSVLAIVELKPLFERGTQSAERGARIFLSQLADRKATKEQIQLHAIALRALEPAFLLLTNVADWFVYDEKAAREAIPIKKLTLDGILQARAEHPNLGSYLKTLTRRG
jgi:hypothetical protein